MRLEYPNCRTAGGLENPRRLKSASGEAENLIEPPDPAGSKGSTEK